MSIKIVSDISKQYLLKEDAVEGFKLAVENGQTRLALQVLVDIIDGMMEIFDYAMEEVAEEDDNIIDVPVAISSPVQEPINVVEAVEIIEEKKVSPKKAAEVKEDTKQTAE